MGLVSIRCNGGLSGHPLVFDSPKVGRRGFELGDSIPPTEDWQLYWISTKETLSKIWCTLISPCHTPVEQILFCQPSKYNFWLSILQTNFFLITILCQIFSVQSSYWLFWSTVLIGFLHLWDTFLCSTCPTLHKWMGSHPVLLHSSHSFANGGFQVVCAYSYVIYKICHLLLIPCLYTIY